MKEINAIIRADHVELIKCTLESISVKRITFSHAIGREKQRGTIQVPDSGVQERGKTRDAKLPEYHIPVKRGIEPVFLPKKMLMIVVNDDDVSRIVNTLTQINRNGEQGGGKIFICPTTDGCPYKDG